MKRERHITLRVLLLLIVVEQRRLHIDRYSSLFAYCTDQLKYSNSSAGRRIAGARCLRDHSRAWPMLFDGRLNLTTLCIIARVITPENADELLDRAAGGTQRQVEDLAAQYGAPKPMRDRIKPVRSLQRSPRPTSHGAPERLGSPHAERATGPGAGATSQSPAACGLGATGGSDSSNGASAAKGSSSWSNCDGDTSTGPTRAHAADEPLTYEITFRADAAFVEKLRRLQALLAAQPNPQLAPIFDRAIELALDRYDPARRQARRELRRTRKTAEASDEPINVPEAERSAVETSNEAGNEVSDEVSSESGNETDSDNDDKSSGMTNDRNPRWPATPPRHALPRRAGLAARRKIPQRLRDLVLARDGHRCTYVGPDGRCPAVTELEIDHICPHAQGGSDHIDNLRIFCRAHNQRAAEVVFGIEFMRRFRGEPLKWPEMKPFTARTGNSVDSEDVAPLEAVPV